MDSASVYTRLTCRKCNKFFIELQRVHASLNLCARCIDEQLTRTGDTQVNCPHCGLVYNVTGTGEQTPGFDQVSNDVKCDECNQYNQDTKQCDECKARICPRCTDLHDREDKCSILQIIRHVEQITPDHELHQRIKEKSRSWKKVIPDIRKARKALNEEADKLVNEIERARAEKLAELDAAEKIAIEREQQLYDASVSGEFAASVRDNVRRVDNPDNVEWLREMIEVLNETLMNIEELLSEDSGHSVDESKQLTVKMSKMKTLLQTETKDASTQKPTTYSDIVRQIDITERHPNSYDIWDIAVSPLIDRVFLTSWEQIENELILVYDTDLEYVRRFESGMQSRWYSFIHANHRGELMITNPDETHIVVMDEFGKRLRKVETGAKCRDLVTDENGCIYVVHYEKQYVAKLNSAGTPLQRIGLTQTGATQIGEGSFLFLSSDHLYFSSASNQSIFVFNLAGDFLTEIDNGLQRNQWPRGVITGADDDGQIMWADQKQHRIYIYSATGRHVATVNEASDALRLPGGIALLPSGEMIVVSCGNKKLIVYR